MKNKGDQKHLTLEQRIEIEKGLVDHKSFSQIAASIGKDPSTISKEIRLHAHTLERPDSEYTHYPCAIRNECKMKGLCEQQCSTLCKICRKPKFTCIEICPAYEIRECEKLTRPPYVCNGCAKKYSCLMPRKMYSSKYAHDEYTSVLGECRSGINQTPESIQKMNDLLTPLIKDKKQSIAHIYATHSEELGCSRRTLYSYIDGGVFEICNADLRRKVRYKKRKKRTKSSEKDKSYRKGHNYEDFQNYMKEHPDMNVVEMDCVEGKKGESKVLLTFTFRNCHLMLIFLLENQNQECVLDVFIWLETFLGQDAFKKLFPVILTDGGREFSAREEMETFCDGTPSTKIFYCDPYCFWQKGACEKNHTYIRYVRPKGNSFSDLTQEKVNLLANHINNEKRDSLNGHSPYELSLLLLDNKLHEVCGISRIEPDEVMLSPKLIK